MFLEQDNKMGQFWSNIEGLGTAILDIIKDLGKIIAQTVKAIKETETLVEPLLKLLLSVIRFVENIVDAINAALADFEFYIQLGNLATLTIVVTVVNKLYRWAVLNPYTDFTKRRDPTHDTEDNISLTSIGSSLFNAYREGAKNRAIIDRSRAESEQRINEIRSKSSLTNTVEEKRHERELEKIKLQAETKKA